MMPTQMVNQDNHDNDVKVKTVYSGDVMITYINQNITLEEFMQEMIAICRFLPDQVFTMKWVDEEGDPCTISTQLELDEALRLYELNRDSELTVHGYLGCNPPNKTLDLNVLVMKPVSIQSEMDEPTNTLDHAYPESILQQEEPLLIVNKTLLNFPVS
ncbi:hypothetical protein MSG28_013045 [Choristoneura fumiferana]|uniref:Uncharacterized protein n=1 Tax=Choristoneura fumiferana TaxID=7141 RepID=A0ACC0KS26_CHOFU|nr:hypothetical protein MSG28_013045 [Choristoneura fumiferana]